MITGIALAALLTNLLVGNAFAWPLTIQLVDKPFGDDKVFIQIKGPYGYNERVYYFWTDINTSPTTASVTMNLPDSEFPSSSEYQVCVSTKESLSFLLPNCYRGEHDSGGESIRVSLS
jgi:hypothetical protein